MNIYFGSFGRRDSIMQFSGKCAQEIKHYLKENTKEYSKKFLLDLSAIADKYGYLLVINKDGDLIFYKDHIHY